MIGGREEATGAPEEVEDNTVHFQATFTHLIQGEPWIYPWEGSVHYYFYSVCLIFFFWGSESETVVACLFMFSFGILKNQLPPHHLGSWFLTLCLIQFVYIELLVIHMFFVHSVGMLRCEAVTWLKSRWRGHFVSTFLVTDSYIYMCVCVFIYIMCVVYFFVPWW